MNVTYSYIPLQKTFERSFLLKSTIIRSNSDTDLFRLIQQNRSTYDDRTECSNLERAIGNPKHFPRKTRQARMFTKGKNRLSQFIQSYSDNLKLIGNKRYNEFNPFLFVKDQMQKVSLSRIGLFPVPLKSQRKVNSPSEMYFYKNIQRSIVSMRRIQYGKTKKREDTLTHAHPPLERVREPVRGKEPSKKRYDVTSIVKIQRWWRLMSKIIKIQKCYRRQRKLKEQQAVNRFNVIMSNLEDCLNKIRAKRCLQVLKHHQMMKRVCLRQYNATKNIIEIKREDVERVITIQSQLRAKQKTGKDQEKHEKGINKKGLSQYSQYGFITKSTLNKIEKLTAIAIVNRITRAYKAHLKRKVVLEKELLLPMMTFKANVILPSFTSKLISGNLKHYTKRQKAVQKPVSALDTQKFHCLKEKETYTTKGGMKLKEEAKPDFEEEEPVIQLYHYEVSVSGITKERYVDNINAVVQLQRAIGRRKRQFVAKKKVVSLCYVDKKVKSIKIRAVVMLCSQLSEVLKRSYFRKKTKPLLNKQFIENRTRSAKKYTLNEDEMDHVVFLQKKYRNRSVLAKKKPSAIFNEDKAMSYVSMTRVENRTHSIIKLQRIAKGDKAAKPRPASIAILPISTAAYISKDCLVSSNHLLCILQQSIRAYLSQKDTSPKNRSLSLLKRKAPSKQSVNITIRPLTSKCYLTLKRVSSPLRLEKSKRVVTNYIDRSISPAKEVLHICSKGKGNNYLIAMFCNQTIKKDLSLNHYITKIRVLRETQEEVPIQSSKLVNNKRISTEIESILPVDNDDNDNDIIPRGDFMNDFILPMAYHISKERRRNLIRFVSLIQRTYLKKQYEVVAKFRAKICVITKECIESIKNNDASIITIQRGYRQKRLNELHKAEAEALSAKSQVKRQFIGKGIEITKVRTYNAINLVITIQRFFIQYQQGKQRHSSTRTVDRPLLDYAFSSKQSFNLINSIHSIVQIQSVVRSFIYQKSFFRNIDSIQLEKFSLQYISKRKRAAPNLPLLEQSFEIQTQRKPISSQNLKFISLLTLFAIKSTQEYIYPLLFSPAYRNANADVSAYPFYFSAIDRHLRFIKSSRSGDSKAKEALNSIFPSNTSLSVTDQIISVNEDRADSPRALKLWSDNIYSQVDKDMVSYLNAFCAYDKKFSNVKFIKERLKQVKLNNTTIFGLTKYIDDEYAALIKGVFCFQCYHLADSCECMTINNNDEDEQFEIEERSIETHSIRNSINHFDYENICQGVIIKRKPKIDEGFEEPVTQIVIVSEEKSKSRDSLFRANELLSEETKEPERKEIAQSAMLLNHRHPSIYLQNKSLSEARRSLAPNKDGTLILLRDEAYHDAI